ncbi:MAG: tetratricopeptide repeat protein [Bryobacteraceae bacterium]
MRSALFWAVLLAVAPQETSGNFADLSAKAARARDANDIESAIRLYREALRLNPAWHEGWWMAGSLQYDSEQYADAAESLGHLVNLTPDAGPAWALLGLCEYETGSFARAFEDIQRGLAIGVGDQPQMIDVLKFHEALLLSKRGEFDSALQLYSTFIPTTISDRQVLLGLGLAALRHANVPTEIPPEQADLFMLAGRAMAAFLTGQYDAAQISCDQLLVRFPDNPDVHFAYGYFVLRTDVQRAIGEWNRTLSIDPSNAAAHAMLSWTFWLEGENEKAFTHAGKAVAGDPNSTVGQIVLGRLLVQKGELATGVEHLERAARKDPTNLEAHLALATAYSEAGRKADSQAERQLCLKMQSEAGAVAQR